MSVDSVRLWQQIGLGEDSGLELKEVQIRANRVSAPRRDGLADELAAFANSDGGRLVLGVSDDREPQALKPEQLDALADYVTEICTDSIEPPLDFSIYRVPLLVTGEEGGVLVVEIPGGDAVHRSPGGYLRRRGDTKRQMQPDEIRRLLQVRGQSDVAATDSQVVRNTGVNTLRPELWRRYASSRASDPDEIALTKLKFVKDDRRGTVRATVGGVLLGADDPRQWLPNAYVQAVCYEGNRLDGNRQLDAQDIGGPLDQQIRDAMRFVVRNRRIAARQQPARSDVPQFSERAVFEVVVNAVVHRDYAVSGSKIRLFMFDDRMEVYSPGGLCNSMKIDDLRTSQFTRNELLASRLGQCPVGDVPGAGGREYFIQRRGEGIPVIEDETFALAGRKPVFELIGERELKVSLPAASPPLPDGIAARITVLHDDTSEPLQDIHVLIVYPNKTYREGRTDAFGHADFELHARLPMTVLCAGPGFKAGVSTNFVPNRPLEVRVSPEPTGGSMIIANRTGHLPGIRGRLHPILDSLDRTYLHADNIAINDGMQQPVQFTLDDAVRLTDSMGAEATLWFREMVGASCVFDYRAGR